jgi:hypothetical protein
VKRHWYFITRYVCVLCWRTDEYRERRYGARPKNPEERCKRVDTACEGHFL